MRARAWSPGRRSSGGFRCGEVLERRQQLAILDEPAHRRRERSGISGGNNETVLSVEDDLLRTEAIARDTAAPAARASLAAREKLSRAMDGMTSTSLVDEHGARLARLERWTEHDGEPPPHPPLFDAVARERPAIETFQVPGRSEHDVDTLHGVIATDIHEADITVRGGSRGRMGNDLDVVGVDTDPLGVDPVGDHECTHRRRRHEDLVEAIERAPQRTPSAPSATPLCGRRHTRSHR